MPAPGNKTRHHWQAAPGKGTRRWKIYRSRIASSILDRQRVRSRLFNLSFVKTIQRNCATGWQGARRKKRHFLRISMQANNSFDKWQADYAAHGVATFPVDANKRPMVRRYSRFGLVGSAEIASKFANAPAIGFMCGKCNGIT